FADHRALIDAVRPQAAIVATPNQTHLAVARDFIRAGIPVLVEKPIADRLDDAEAMTREATSAGVPLMVGHHRRHNPIIRAARTAIREGRIGILTAASVLYTWLKDDAYFDLRWRRELGGGPVLINLIHEIDLIRFVCGEIVGVQAVTSNARRGFAVEDTAAVILQLAGGALVSIAISDTTTSPWSWDLAAGESPAVFPSQAEPVQTHFFAGTEGSLTLPGLVHWHYGARRGWHEPILHETLPVVRANPYEEQLRHLVRVTAGLEAPLSDGADATRTLAATLAVHRAAASGGMVHLT
ncbi:MAG: Gfo/Idh/MocA family oxidoreductase, partial [Rhodospirillales bacterium]|nr:Gfo/Idh/MocA family oxidoreductase [Rhodospirillales bacterium]